MISRQLFLDMDGVLADFDLLYLEKFGVLLDRSNPADRDDPSDIWDNIKSVETFYLDLPMMKDADELWKGALKLHSNPVLITGVPRSIIDSENQKREWARKYLGSDVKVICCRSKDKSNYAKTGDVLIDDWFKYRHLWESAGGIFILHTSAIKSLAEAECYFTGEYV